MKAIMLCAAMGITVAAVWQSATCAIGAKWAVATDQQERAEVIEAPPPVSPRFAAPPATPRYAEPRADADESSISGGHVSGGCSAEGCEGDCDACEAFGQGGCGCVPLGCEEGPWVNLAAMIGFDSFKGVSDDGLSHFGLVTGLNGAGAIPMLSQYGLGWQVGASYGVYDFEGKPGTVSGTQLSSGQQQVFVTTGFFRKAQPGGRLSFGLVHDWMIADDWGIVPTPATLGQFRGQVEYALDPCNAIGVWGSVRERNDLRCVRFEILEQLSVQLPVTTRSINQADLFWHHKFACGADGRIWFGFPEQSRLDERFGGSLGEWIFGADFQAPLNPSLALYANVQYMKPSAEAQSVNGFPGSLEESYNLGLGIIWYPGRNARTRSLVGGCWTPYLPVANNSTFLVDQTAGPASIVGGDAN